MALQGSAINLQGGSLRGGISLQPTRPTLKVQSAPSNSYNILQPTVGHSINQTPYNGPAPTVHSAPQPAPVYRPAAPAAPAAPAPVYRFADGSTAASAAQAREAADTASFYDDMINQLNGQNGRLDAQLNTGIGNINNSYNLQANRLNEQKGVAKRNYDVQTQQNMQGYSNTRNGIMNNTRATANALQRLLGLNGAGNSSAALEQAPYAAGLQGSQNLNEAQQNYATNTQGLKMSWEDTERTFKNNFQDLDQQKYSQENNLRSQINQTRAGLLDKIAQANINREMAKGKSYQQAQAARTPYQDQINGLLDSIAGLGNQFANPVMRTGDVSFKAPELGRFSLGQSANIQNQTGGGGNLDPTFVNLFSPREDERNRLGY